MVMMLVSDKRIDEMRVGALGMGATVLAEALKELQERRKNDRPESHEPLAWKESKIGIYEVQCACGEITEHRVPLRTINDFKCPKSPVKE